MNRLEKIGVLGLARSGRAAAELALQLGAEVFASDAGDSESLREAAEAIRRAGGDAEVGGHTVGKLAACRLLVISPGISPDAPVLQEPALLKKRRVSELEFAFSHLKCPVIAVTGTNGKTTVTALAAHLLNESGFDAPAAGNIGVPLSEIAGRDVQPDWAVVEASSFQLANIHGFSPRIGVFTNLSPDHLDRYPSVESYYADKARLFRNATPDSAWVLNGDDRAVLDLAGSVAGDRYHFRLQGPLTAAESGAFLAPDGHLTVRLAHREYGLVQARQMKLLGEHNVANSLAAALAALLAGADVHAVKRGLVGFQALPHRLEPVAEADDVLWINDSKATNLASTRVALRSMSRPTVLLLGGIHKGEPYTNLLPELRERVRLVIAFGDAGDLIASELADHVPVQRVEGDLEGVVRQAVTAAQPGDAVLFSPACSSFDMFSGYEERGTRFSDLARAWMARSLGNKTGKSRGGSGGSRG